MEISAVRAGGLPATLDSRGSASTGVVRSQSATALDARDRTGLSKGGPFKADPRGLALGILKQELRSAFSGRSATGAPAAAYPEPAPSVAGVVGEALAAVERLLSQFPLRGTEITDAARADADLSVDVARDIANADDLEEIDDALEDIREGLQELEDDATRNVASQAYVLSADSELKERSTIRIRTQDGDVVVLDLRRSESFAYDAFGTDDASLERIEAGAQSRLSFSVRGELDEAEMAAIRSVFEQAESVASEFFGGDTAKAFESASALSFDATELSGVRLKFRQLETSRIEAAVSITRPLVADQPAPAVEPPATLDRIQDSPSGIDASDNDVAEAPAAEPDQPVVGEPPTTEGPVNDFLQQLSAFLRDTLQGFESTDGQRYFFTESFKFSLLKSALSVAMPETAATATERANALIDAVSDEAS